MERGSKVFLVFFSGTSIMDYQTLSTIQIAKSRRNMLQKGHKTLLGTTLKQNI